MITAEEQNYIEEHGYVPEHMTHYVTAVSGAVPFLVRNFLAYVRKGRLTFVGYPLGEAFEEKRMEQALAEVLERFGPTEVSLAAPAVPASVTPGVESLSDQYYRLDLGELSIPQKVRNMITRATRGLSVEKRDRIDKDHKQLVQEFLKAHPVGQEMRFIFEKIPGYVSSSATVWVYGVRDKKGELVAFDVGELAPKDYAFYMFNFASRRRFVPGASDLLLYELIQHAKAEGKRYINLGLGINRGVTFFKEKWGGTPFLPYASCVYTPSRKERLETLFQKL